MTKPEDMRLTLRAGLSMLVAGRGEPGHTR